MLGLETQLSPMEEGFSFDFIGISLGQFAFMVGRWLLTDHMFFLKLQIFLENSKY